MERGEGGRRREETHGQGERQELREEQDNKGGEHDGRCGFGCLVSEVVGVGIKVEGI